MLLPLAALLLIIFSSCSYYTPGNTSELTAYDWYAKLENNTEINLSFSDDTANMSFKFAKEERSISGKYFADDQSFVIFMPELYKNYRFEYTPKNTTLELEYNGSKITLHAR